MLAQLNLAELGYLRIVFALYGRKMVLCSTKTAISSIIFSLRANYGTYLEKNSFHFVITFLLEKILAWLKSFQWITNPFNPIWDKI